MKNPTIISLGGSLIVPDEIDTDFLKRFIGFVKERVAKGERLILITGGGKICRRYQKAAAELGATSPDDNDWVGIYVTRLNGEFLRVVLGDLAHPSLIINPSNIGVVTRPVVIAAGGVPGHSTDFDAVELAATVGARRIVNLSNIDYAYDKDPKKFPEAKKIECMNWSEFRKLLPERWDPGLNSPFDPIASKKAESLGLEVAIMNGRNISNLTNYLDGKPFEGSLISP